MKLIIDNAIPFIRGRFTKDVEVVYLPGKEICPEVVRDADGLIIRTRTRCDEFLLKDSKVKAIATATIGTDHIDYKWCENMGITVRNAPGCNAPGVAQYVLSSLFKTGFNQDTDTLGIIGYGHVGSLVADWALKMGIKVLISDDPRKEATFEDVDYLSMKEVLEKSDAVTLHVPFTNDGMHPTYKLIGEKELSLMQNGAVIVNTSRGGVVDESALKEAIKRGKVKGIVDVWENEPIIDRELVDLVNIATPHIAGYSKEGKKRATRMALEGIAEILGLKLDLNGLECNPRTDISISPQLIESSYNPFKDTEALRRDINTFEFLRNNYLYRSEPLFL